MLCSGQRAFPRCAALKPEGDASAFSPYLIVLVWLLQCAGVVSTPHGFCDTVVPAVSVSDACGNPCSPE